MLKEKRTGRLAGAVGAWGGRRERAEGLRGGVRSAEERAWSGAHGAGGGWGTRWWGRRDGGGHGGTDGGRGQGAPELSCESPSQVSGLGDGSIRFLDVGEITVQTAWQGETLFLYFYVKHCARRSRTENGKALGLSRFGVPALEKLSLAILPLFCALGHGTFTCLLCVQHQMGLWAGNGDPRPAGHPGGL